MAEVSGYYPDSSNMKTYKRTELLLAVIEQIFLSPGELEMFLADISRRYWDMVGRDDDFKIARSKIVQHAERNGWVLDLLKALHQKVREGTTAKEQLDQIATLEEVKELRFFDDYYVYGEPLVDRGELRAKLRNAAKDDAKRILLIHSERPQSGKSHSIRHIRHVATALGIPLLVIELRHYVEPAKEIEPSELAALIAQTLKLDIVKPTDQKVARWTVNFFISLARELGDRPLWIVFDDFDKTSVPPAIHDFIDKLAENIVNALFGVRLFLINYDKPLSNELAFQLVRQGVPEIGEAEIAYFFLEFYRDRLPATDPEAAADDAVRRARLVMEKMTGSSTRLLTMKTAVREHCDELKGEGG